MAVLPVTAGTARPTTRSSASIISTGPVRRSRTCSTTSRPRRSISTPTTTRRAPPSTAANGYEMTFAPGQEPPVNGFWSLTLYNEHHFFHPNDLKRYSLGTKNKKLEAKRRRLADALCGREIAGQGQGEQLAAGAGRPLLALHPRLLGQAADPRRLVAAAENRDGELSSLRGDCGQSCLTPPMPIIERKRPCRRKQSDARIWPKRVRR